jgi:DNA-binding transcriptional LysR family regulator
MDCIDSVHATPCHAKIARMTRPDFNLLVTLDVLLAEGNVARAARRLGLSASAMSRSLARLRETTGDPLLVRAGRGLVPTPRAIELRERVAQVVRDAESVLRPVERLDLARLERTFTLRTRDGFVENYGAALIARIAAQAPGVSLRFAPKPDKDNAPLREGSVDLETGVVGQSTGPEMRVQALLRDRFVGVVRAGHPLARGRVTASRYAKAGHVAVARRPGHRGAIEDALDALGLQRRIVTSVDGFTGALALARDTDLVASVPERHTGRLREGLHTFTLPFELPPFTVSLVWHPRMHADAAHRWLRELVREVCSAPEPSRRPRA